MSKPNFIEIHQDISEPQLWTWYWLHKKRKKIAKITRIHCLCKENCVNWFYWISKMTDILMTLTEKLFFDG